MSEHEDAQRALENVARRREEVMELGREISRTPGWSAWLEVPGVLRLEYVHWPPDVTPHGSMYVENRAQWEAWRKAVENYKPAPERIKELEQQLAQARALLEAFAHMPVASDYRGEWCLLCGARNTGPVAALQHKPDCPVGQARAFLAAQPPSQ